VSSLPFNKAIADSDVVALGHFHTVHSIARDFTVQQRNSLRGSERDYAPPKGVDQSRSLDNNIASLRQLYAMVLSSAGSDRSAAG